MMRFPRNGYASTLDPKVRASAAALVVGTMAVVFDSTIMNVAIKTLAQAFSAPVSTIQWVTTGYTLALAMAVPVTGWAQKRFGAKHLWMFALVLFLVGSIGSALSWSALTLIIFRVVQGAAGGVMMPVMQNLLMRAAGGRNLGTMMATIGLPIMLGPILGPLIGGWILTYFTWHWIFLINIPICLVAMGMAWRLIPPDTDTEKARLDALGLTMVAGGVAALLFGLSEAGAEDTVNSPLVWVPVLVGLALLALFAWRMLTQTREPLIEVRLFKYRTFTASSIALTISGFSMYAASLLMPLYYQQVRGSTALAAGIALIPQGIGTLATRTLAGRLTDKIGGRSVVTVGAVIALIGTVPFAFADAHTPTWFLMATLVVRGAGLGGVTVPTMSCAFIGVPPNLIPSVSIVTRTMLQIGSSFGAAAAAVILEQAARSVGHGNAASAFNVAFWWVIAFSGLMVVAGLFMSGRGVNSTRQTVLDVLE